MRITEIGMFLQQLRADKGVSQGTMAKALGVTNSYISNMEQGVHVPTKEMLDKIAGYFELDETGKDELTEAADISRNFLPISNFQTLPIAARRTILLLQKYGADMKDADAERILRVAEQAVGKKN